MSKKQLLSALAAAALSLASATVFACGESIFHTGHAMRYRAFITRRPAAILIYSPGSWENGAARAELYSGLQNAGHHVTVVGDAQALSQALMARNYDVVIARAGDIAAIQAQVPKSEAEPSFLALGGADAKSNDRLRQQYTGVLREGADLNQYLKSIEKTMETRKS